MTHIHHTMLTHTQTARVLRKYPPVQNAAYTQPMVAAACRGCSGVRALFLMQFQPCRSHLRPFKPTFGSPFNSFVPCAHSLLVVIGCRVVRMLLVLGDQTSQWVGGEQTSQKVGGEQRRVDQTSQRVGREPTIGDQTSQRVGRICRGE